MNLNWINYRVITRCCGYKYIATIPSIRNTELECPKCRKMNNPYLTKLIGDNAISIASQVWCDPRCSDIEMDTRLAEVFAEKIDKLLTVVNQVRSHLDTFYPCKYGDCSYALLIDVLEELDQE